MTKHKREKGLPPQLPDDEGNEGTYFIKLNMLKTNCLPGNMNKSRHTF